MKLLCIHRMSKSIPGLVITAISLLSSACGQNTAQLESPHDADSAGRTEGNSLNLSLSPRAEPSQPDITPEPNSCNNVSMNSTKTLPDATTRLDVTVLISAKDVEKNEALKKNIDPRLLRTLLGLPQTEAFSNLENIFSPDTNQPVGFTSGLHMHMIDAAIKSGAKYRIQTCSGHWRDYGFLDVNDYAPGKFPTAIIVISIDGKDYAFMTQDGPKRQLKLSGGKSQARSTEFWNERWSETKYDSKWDVFWFTGAIESEIKSEIDKNPELYPKEKKPHTTYYPTALVPIGILPKSWMDGVLDKQMTSLCEDLNRGKNIADLRFAADAAQTTIDVGSMLNMPVFVSLQLYYAYNKWDSNDIHGSLWNFKDAGVAAATLGLFSKVQLVKSVSIAGMTYLVIAESVEIANDYNKNSGVTTGVKVGVVVVNGVLTLAVTIPIIKKLTAAGKFDKWHFDLPPGKTDRNKLFQGLIDDVGLPALLPPTGKNELLISDKVKEITQLTEAEKKLGWLNVTKKLAEIYRVQGPKAGASALTYVTWRFLTGNPVRGNEMLIVSLREKALANLERIFNNSRAELNRLLDYYGVIHSGIGGLHPIKYVKDGVETEEKWHVAVASVWKKLTEPKLEIDLFTMPHEDLVKKIGTTFKELYPVSEKIKISNHQRQFPELVALFIKQGTVAGDAAGAHTLERLVNTSLDENARKLLSGGDLKTIVSASRLDSLASFTTEGAWWKFWREKASVEKKEPVNFVIRFKTTDIPEALLLPVSGSDKVVAQGILANLLTEQKNLTAEITKWEQIKNNPTASLDDLNKAKEKLEQLNKKNEAINRVVFASKETVVDVSQLYRAKNLEVKVTKEIFTLPNGTTRELDVFTLQQINKKDLPTAVEFVSEQTRSLSVSAPPWLALVKLFLPNNGQPELVGSPNGPLSEAQKGEIKKIRDAQEKTDMNRDPTGLPGNGLRPFFTLNLCGGINWFSFAHDLIQRMCLVPPNQACLANWEKRPQYTVSAVAIPSRLSSKITCEIIGQNFSDSKSCERKFEHGTDVLVSANMVNGFKNWEGCDLLGDHPPGPNECTGHMVSDRRVVANFNDNPPTCQAEPISTMKNQDKEDFKKIEKKCRVSPGGNGSYSVSFPSSTPDNQFLLLPDSVTGCPHQTFPDSAGTISCDALPNSSLTATYAKRQNTGDKAKVTLKITVDGRLVFGEGLGNTAISPNISYMGETGPDPLYWGDYLLSYNPNKYYRLDKNPPIGCLIWNHAAFGTAPRFKCSVNAKGVLDVTLAFTFVSNGGQNTSASPPVQPNQRSLVCNLSGTNKSSAKFSAKGFQKACQEAGLGGTLVSAIGETGNVTPALCPCAAP